MAPRCLRCLPVWLLILPGLARAEPHAALGAAVEISVPLNPRYPGKDGAATLVDGVVAETSYGKGIALGFEGQDVEITVRLEEATRIRTIAADFLQITSPAIYLPVSVDFAVSENGTNFRTVATVEPKATEKDAGPLHERIQAAGLDLKAQAVRIRVANGGRVPPDHRSPQALRWTFISEVLVNPGDKPKSVWDALRAYQFGGSRTSLTRVERMLRGKDADERAAVLKALRELLSDKEATVDAKRFACEMLGLHGGQADVPALAVALDDTKLLEPAAAALASLGNPEAEKALRAALPKAKDKGTLVNALARFHSAAATQALAALLGEPKVGQLAGRALGRAGGTEAVKALSAAFSDNDDATRRQWLGEALLAAADRAELTADLRAESLGLLMAKGTPAMQLAGAGALLRYDMDRAALARVIVAAKSTVRSERAQATTFLGTCVERHGIGSLGDGFDSLPLDVKCALVRHESGAERLLSQLGRAREKPLQLEVLKRIGQCGDETVIPPLCERLEGAAEGDQRAAVVDALVALPATPAVSQAFRAYKIRVNGKARESLAEVFARRGLATFGPDVLGWIQQGLVPADKGWRALAELAGPPLLAPLTRELAKNPEHRKLIGKALLAAAKRCEDVQTGAPLTKRLAVAPDAEEREILVQALGELGDRQSLASALGDASLDVRLAAIRALGEHGEATDVPLLLKAAEVPDPRQNALALRAALQVLCSRLDPVFAPPEAGDWLRVASQAARRDEERRQVAQTAARFPQAALLPLLGDTPDAFLDVAEAVWPDAPDAVRSRLSRLVAETKDQKIKARAQTVLGRIAAFQPFLGKLAERPWQPAFNGRNLDGWRPVGGKPDSWTVADGLLVANAGGGGWLARAEEMGDYLFELEFRLSPGGNSGFFLRPPLAGNPAWEGIEVQMLDDAASQYAGKLRADQYCASIYGMGPAQPGISRPPGQWQKLRVLCAGRHVAVWLNGKPVSYAALDEHMGKADKIHGLNRASGFPGLQNEHGPTQFRNLRFRDLR